MSEFTTDRSTRDGLSRKCRDCKRSMSLVWSRAHPLRHRAYYLKCSYGLTEEMWEAMRADQGNACAICRETFTSTPHTDHSHTTGHVRALTCGPCNRAIGMMQDNPERLEAAAAYLRLHASTLHRTTDDAKH